MSDWSLESVLGVGEPIHCSEEDNPYHHHEEPVYGGIEVPGTYLVGKKYRQLLPKSQIQEMHPNGKENLPKDIGVSGKSGFGKIVLKKIGRP